MKKILFLVQVIILSISFFNCSKASKNITKETKIGQSMSVTEEGLRADELEKIGKAFLLTSISTDAEYGFSEKKPINVAYKKPGDNMAANEYLYMNALTGPNGEKITFRRISSCCPRPSPNGFMGSALLDKFEVKIADSNKTYILYLNMYDSGVVKAPLGFNFIK